MSTLVFVDLEISTQADEAQSSRVPVPLSKDPNKAIRESKGFGMPDARSTSLDSTVPLLPDYSLTHTTLVLVPFLRRNALFRKRFKSSYDSLPSPTFLAQKRYRGTFELIFDTDSEGDELGEEEDEEEEKSSDLNSKSKDAEDEGTTVEDEDPAVGDEGLAVGDKGPSIRVEKISWKMELSYFNKYVFGYANWSSYRSVRKLKNHLRRSKLGKRKLSPNRKWHQVDACPQICQG
nr:hypothetical protein [Tanacetum cinerariifolium]